MNKNKQLAAQMAGMLVVATLAGTSAFAESRHAEGTRARGDASATVRRGSVSARGEVGRGNESRNGGSVDRRSARSAERRSETPRATAPVRERRSVERRSEGPARERRNEGRTVERRREGRAQDPTFDRRPNASNDSRTRNENRRNSARGFNDGERRNGNRGNEGYRRNDNRGRNDGNRRGSWGNNRGGSHGRGRGYYHHGRVSHYQRYGGGYRVWIIGAPYPYYVPLAYWRADRFRIGLSIGLGGYYNPGGYYDYYDGYRGGYDNNLHSEADFRGVVESVDWRRDTFVVRNEETGNFITVVLRDRDEGDVRPGDFVSVRGDWTTRGYFRAYDVDVLD